MKYAIRNKKQGRASGYISYDSTSNTSGCIFLKLSSNKQPEITFQTIKAYLEDLGYELIDITQCSGGSLGRRSVSTSRLSEHYKRPLKKTRNDYLAHANEKIEVLCECGDLFESELIIKDNQKYQKMYCKKCIEKDVLGELFIKKIQKAVN